MKTKTALIIGGTTGSGRATATAFAEAEFNVVIAGRGADRGRDVEKHIQSLGQEALFVETDVSREAQVKRLMEQAVDCFGRIHVAVNNAGVEGKVGPFRMLQKKISIS